MSESIQTPQGSRKSWAMPVQLNIKNDRSRVQLWSATRLFHRTSKRHYAKAANLPDQHSVNGNSYWSQLNFLTAEYQKSYIQMMILTYAT